MNRIHTRCRARNTELGDNVSGRIERITGRIIPIQKSNKSSEW
jgi:hypothetical protein